MQHDISSVVPMPWTDLPLHSAWNKCWNYNAAVTAVVFSGLELLSPPPSPPSSPVLLSADAPLYPRHCLYAMGVQSGLSLQHRSSRSNAPASRSLRRVWDNGGRDSVFLRVLGRDRKRAEYGGTVKGRGCESEFLGLWSAVRMEVPCWAFMPGLWDQAQLNTHRVNRDPHALFFSHRVQRCVFTLWWTGNLYSPASLPFAHCMRGRDPDPPPHSRLW